MNIKSEIHEHKARITNLNNQISCCYNPELKQHLTYELYQEQLKLESCELLLALSQKAGVDYQ